MEIISVVIVKNNVLEKVRTFGNVDEQDTSGGEAAEKTFEEEVMHYVNPKEDDVDMEIWLDNGYFEKEDVNVYITHSWIENLQI